MTKTCFFQLLEYGYFHYDTVRFNEPDYKLLSFNWKQVKLTLEGLDYQSAPPTTCFLGFNKKGKEYQIQMPIQMKSLSVELPFDLKKFQNHYLSMFGEDILVHEIRLALNKHFGEKKLLKAFYEQDYSKLAFLVKEKHKKKQARNVL